MKKTLAFVLAAVGLSAVSSHAAIDAAYTTGLTTLETDGLAYVAGIVGVIILIGTAKIGPSAAKWVTGQIRSMFGK